MVGMLSGYSLLLRDCWIKIDISNANPGLVKINIADLFDKKYGIMV